MHPYHSAVPVHIGWQGAESQQGRGGRNVSPGQEVGERLLGVADKHALTEHHQRSFRLVYHFRSPVQSCRIGFAFRYVAAYETAFPEGVFHHTELGVLREIEHHRPRPACRGNVEGPRHRPGHILRPAYLVVPFRDRACEAYDVRLLEGIGSECRGSHLS